jgi:succinate-acetate transporter protein
MAQIATERSEPAVAAVANPAPLGLSAFALTTFVLSVVNAGLIAAPKGINPASIVIGLALFYGGITQLIAGLQEFRAGNTFGATAFCSYGGFWLALGFILLPGSGIVASFIPKGAAAPDPSFDTALGFFLLGWTIFTGLMFLATLRSNIALILVFGVLFLTFLFLTIGALGGGSSMTMIGGWLGIITALLAWYTALAGILASSKSMFTLPVGPRS